MRDRLLRSFSTLLAFAAMWSSPVLAQEFGEKTGPFGIAYDAPADWQEHDTLTTSLNAGAALSSSPVARSDWGKHLDASRHVFSIRHMCGDYWSATLAAQIVPVPRTSWMSRDQADQIYRIDGSIIKLMMPFTIQSTVNKMMDTGRFQSVTYRGTSFQYFTRLSCTAIQFDLILKSGALAEQRTSTCPMGAHQLVFTLIYTPGHGKAYTDIADHVIESVRWVE